MGEGGNICSDVPRYWVYENGVVTKELTDVTAYWKEGYVGFLIGCSFSFEEALMAAGVPVRHIEISETFPCLRPIFRPRRWAPLRVPWYAPCVP